MTSLGLGVAPAALATTHASSKSPSALVPAKIRATGKLTDLVNSPFPPMEYQAKAGGPIVGVDIDIAKAIAGALKLKLVVTNTPNFSELIPAVESNRTDIVTSGTFDLNSRHKVVHFVDYFRTGDQFFGLLKNSRSVTSYKGLCGKTVAVQSGTSYPVQVAKLSAQVCPKANPIGVLTVASPPDQVQQVKIGRAIALVQGPEENAFLSLKQPGLWHVIGKTFHKVNYGIMFSKSDPQLGKALQAGLNELIRNGKYHKILAKWKLTGSAVPRATINAGT